MSFPWKVPPHEPVYQYQSAPVPNVPSNNLFVLPHTVVPVRVGSVDKTFTVIVIFAHAVVLQIPSALTK